MNVSPCFSAEDLNRAKTFLRPAVQTYQISEESFQSIINTLKEVLNKKLESTKENWLTPKEVCKKLKIRKPTLYRLFHTGKIQIIKVGRSTRILESDIIKVFGNLSND